MTASFEVNGEAGVIVDGGGTATTWDASANGFTNQDFMRWDSVVADANGKIIVNVTHQSGGYTFFNGLRVSAVPEPSSLVLLSLLVVSGAVMWWRRPVR